MTPLDLTRLHRPGMVFMLSWLSAAAECGEVVDAAKVREVYGRAADYETVHNARIVLAGQVAA